MDQLAPTETIFALPLLHRRGMGELRADTPLTLTADEVTRLRSLNDPIDLDEVERIYLPLSRLLSLYVEASQRLFRQRQALPQRRRRTRRPSSSASPARSRSASRPPRASCKALLARWPSSPKVDLVTTDGFLLPNAVLRRSKA